MTDDQRPASVVHGRDRPGADDRFGPDAGRIAQRDGNPWSGHILILAAC